MRLPVTACVHHPPLPLPLLPARCKRAPYPAKHRGDNGADRQIGRIKSPIVARPQSLAAKESGIIEFSAQFHGVGGGGHPFAYAGLPIGLGCWLIDWWLAEPLFWVSKK